MSVATEGSRDSAGQPSPGNRRLPRRRLAPAAAAVLGLLLVIGFLRSERGRRLWQRPADWPRTHEFLLANIIPVEIKVYTPVPGLETLFRSCEEETARLVQVFSRYEPESELSRLNRVPPGETVPISPDMRDLLGRAFTAHEVTDGAFDITVLPLVRLWQEAGKTGVLPAAAELERVRAQIGMDKIVFQPEPATIRRQAPDVQFDTGGVSKGYIVDRLVAILREAGVRRALVNVGGDLRAFGGSAEQSFRIGVQHPRRPSKMIGVIRFTASAVATSGDYQQYALIDGKRYSHILDPRTGEPVAWSPSVTVLAADAVTADALATGVSVLGADRGLAVIESLRHTECLIVRLQGKRLDLIMSDGMRQLFSAAP